MVKTLNFMAAKIKGFTVYNFWYFGIMWLYLDSLMQFWKNVITGYIGWLILQIIKMFW